MTKYVITATLMVFLLASCAEEPKSSSGYKLFAGCEDQNPSFVKTLEVRYSPADKGLLVAAFFHRDVYPNSDTFYFTGSLVDGTELVDPLGRKPNLKIKCKDSHCRQFNFRLESELMNHNEDVTVRRYEIEKTEALRNKSFSTKPEIATGPQGEKIGPYRTSEQEWHYSLEKGIKIEDSSFISTCLGGRPLMTLYLGVDEATSMGQSYYSISGELNANKFEANALQNVDDRPISSSYGSMEFQIKESDLSMTVKSPSAELTVTFGQK